MKKFDQLVEDHSTTPVPNDKTTSGFRVALIVLGVSIALPAFLSGTKIGMAVGLIDAVIAFLVGGVILAVIGSLTSIVGARTRLTTYMLVQLCFGPKGAHFVNFLLAATMFGWFGVNAVLFGSAVVTALQSLGWSTVPDAVYVVMGSVLMIATTIFGFKGLDKLSLFAVPVLMVILAAIMTKSLSHAKIDTILTAGDYSMSLGLAISAVIGGKMVAVATMPDVARYLPNRRQAILAMVLTYVIGAPVVLVCAAVPSLVTGEPDLMKIVTGLGLGVWALLLMVFATWTTNAANLYSSGLGLASIFKRIHRWKLTALAGILGTMVALTGIVDWFIPFLIALSVVVPPIAGIYVAHFLITRNTPRIEDLPLLPAVNYRAFIAWGLGSGMAFITSRGTITLTGIPACDAALLSAFAYYVLCQAVRHRPFITSANQDV